jgi:hypothetical protein
MTAALIVSGDGELRNRLESLDVSWATNPEEFDRALETGIEIALIDVCLDCGRDVGELVRACRDRGGARRVVAFLSSCAGENAIRAHLAGADRVIPLDQIETELSPDS